MKKVYGILILLLVLAISFTGCDTGVSSDSPTDTSSDDTRSEATEAPTEVTDPVIREENVIFSNEFNKYVVVVDDSAGGQVKTLAKNLTDTVNSAWGSAATLVQDESTSNSAFEILVGNTNRSETEQFRKTLKDGECGYGVIGSKIVILGSDDTYTERAVVLFANLALLSKDAEAEEYMTDGDNRVVDATDMISVMSYNVKVGNSDNNPGTVTAMIRNYMPDLVGVQEADSGWIGVLDNRLSKNGYEYVGVGRDADGGERSAIFYRADKFELLDSDTFWLTSTPTEVSRVDGSLCNRIVTVATFKRISDGKIFTHANTHLDHSNSDVRSAQVTYLDKYVKEFTDSPLIVTGDFNFQPDNRVYTQMTALGYENCSQLAQFARGREDNTYTGGSMIDFCFRYGEDFKPYFYAVCDELINGKTPSDHHPIFLILELE